MPYYTFIDKTTGEEFEHMLSISEREVFIQKNPPSYAKTNHACDRRSSETGYYKNT